MNTIRSVSQMLFDYQPRRAVAYHLLFFSYIHFIILYYSSKKLRSFNINYNIITVFLSGFGAFLRSEMKFSKLLVQPPHHLVTCAHHKSSFSFFWTNCDCFGTFMQLIMYICLRFHTFSVVNIMLLKMYYIVLSAIVFPLKTSSH